MIEENNMLNNRLDKALNDLDSVRTEQKSMQKYLQPDLLKEKGIYHFDAWAANFGEIVTSMELSPEGYTLVGR